MAETKLELTQIKAPSTDNNSQNTSLLDHLTENDSRLSSCENTLADQTNSITDLTTSVNDLLANHSISKIADFSSLPSVNNSYGDLYFVEGEGQFYYWTDLSTWQSISGSLLRGTVFPTTNLFSGLEYYRTDLEMLFIYNGTSQAWVQK